MIVLDAGMLIALWDRQDAHYAAARSIIQQHSSAVMHSINVGEALVHPIRRGLEHWARTQLSALDIREAPPVPEEAFLLARARAETGLKMPDCCSLVTAESLQLPLATLDRRLAKVARQRGVRVLPAE